MYIQNIYNCLQRIPLEAYFVRFLSLAAQKLAQAQKLLDSLT